LSNPTARGFCLFFHKDADMWQTDDFWGWLFVFGFVNNGIIWFGYSDIDFSLGHGFKNDI
jgi:hypothetical protein